MKRGLRVLAAAGLGDIGDDGRYRRRFRPKAGRCITHARTRFAAEEAGQGRCAADHLLQPVRVLLAASGQGLDDDGQQHHQQLAHGRRRVG